METQELYDILVETLFPKEITEHFKIVRVDALPEVLVVHFEEKDEYRITRKIMGLPGTGP